MNRSSTGALATLLLLAGCAGTPKLARCTGPYRYANPYGTVLPTLPVPGQVSSPAAPTVPAVPAPTGSFMNGAPSVPDPSPPPPTAAAHPEPGKISALAPAYPSC